MPTNNQLRQYAFSGNATLADLPFLYARAAQSPELLALPGGGAAGQTNTGGAISVPGVSASLGASGGSVGGGSVGAAPSMSAASLGADTVSGGMTRGGGGEPGGPSAGVDSTGYIDIGALGLPLDLVQALGPMGLGLIAGLGKVGARMNNLNHLTGQLQAAGFTDPLGMAQRIGALLGPDLGNGIAEGDAGAVLAGSAMAQRNALQSGSYVDPSGMKTSPSGPMSRLGRGGDRDRGGSFGGGRNNAEGGLGGIGRDPTRGGKNMGGGGAVL